MKIIFQGNITIRIFTILVLWVTLRGMVFSQSGLPEGFASLDTLGQNSTTGGKGGTIITVTNTAEFLANVFSTDTLVILVADTIQLTSMVGVSSHKTIRGVGNQGVISGGGLNLSNVSNVIIQNMLFQNSSDDAINVQEYTHHIWIDHCDFTNAFDGLVDIKRGANFITVSWNKFFNHQKTCLLGHDDNNAVQDSGRLQVSYHHNWFDGTGSRHPRVRFSGLCHVYNNYYNNNDYGVASTMSAEVLVEGNYFYMVTDPTLVGYGSSGPGDLVQSNNIFDNCTNPPQVGGSVPTPPYTYNLDDPVDIPAIVSSNAGRAGFLPPLQPQWLVYDANVLPDQNIPPYAPDNVVNPPDTSNWVIDDPDIPGNKLLKFVDSLATSRFMWGIDWNMIPGRGATIAFRVKPIDTTVFDRAFEVEFRDGVLRERLFVLPGGIIELDRADVAAPLPYDPDGWHTYRITYQNGLSTVYVDEQIDIFLSGTTPSTNTTKDLRFGDGSDGFSYGFLLDWFIFDTTGVYKPGESNIPDSLFVDGPATIIAEEKNEIPLSYQIAQNYPNPFNPSTTIEFSLAKSGKVILSVYNALGQQVTTLVDGWLESGRHQVIFKAEKISSGIYFIKLDSGDFSGVRKMILVR
jgi:pectate lyase